MKESTKNKLGFWSIFFLGINTIIGSGIFLLPSKAYNDVGMGSLIIIILNAFLALSFAFCYAEASSIFNKNGSSFIYAKEAYGNFIGFEIGIFAWFIGIITWATEIQGFLTALSGIYPKILNSDFNKIFVVLIGISLGLLNYLGVKISKILNNVITVSKLIPLFLFILIGLFFIDFSNFIGFFYKIKIGIEGDNFAAATLLIFYAFTGFDLLAVAAEDMDNPKKNLPKAIISVILFCSIFYLGIMIVCIGILGKNLALTHIPIAQATKTIFGNIGYLFITVATLISIGGITIALSFISPRSLEALSDTKYLPSIFSKKGRFNTPTYSILLTTLLTMALAMYGDFIFLAGLTVIARLIEFISTAGAIIVFRKRRISSQYKMPLGSIIPYVAIIISLWLISKSSMENYIIIFLGLFIGYLCYIFYAKKQLNNIK